MRTNWAAAAVGLWLAVVAGLTRVDSGRPLAAEHQANCQMEELVNQSEGGGQIGAFLRFDPRPWWQRWIDPVEWLFPKYPSHLTPERLTGGIM